LGLNQESAEPAERNRPYPDGGSSRRGFRVVTAFFSKQWLFVELLAARELYLHTHDRSDYYAKRGWQVQEYFQAWGKEQWLMLRDL